MLIPAFGFVAAGYTTLASYIVFTLSNYYAMKRILKKRKLPNNLYDYKGLLLLFLAFMLIGFLGVALYSWLIPRMIISILVLVLIFLNRNSFFNAIKIIRKK